MDIAGGACDGIFDPTRGYVMRGGREMENHFECLWDLFRSIPSLEVPNASVLDEFYWLNKHDPNYSLCRATVNRGETFQYSAIAIFSARYASIRLVCACVHESCADNTSAMLAFPSL